MTPPRFCKDCRHFVDVNTRLMYGYVPPACRVATARGKPDLVWGGRPPIAAAQERQNTIDGCGPHGRHFEARPLPWWRRWFGGRA